MDHTDDCTCTECLQRHCIEAQREEIERLRTRVEVLEIESRGITTFHRSTAEERDRYREALERIANDIEHDTTRWAWEIAREALGGGRG